MKKIIEKIIKYIFDKYEIQEIEIGFPYTEEIVNKKNIKRLEEEVGNKLNLGMFVRRPYIKRIVKKWN